jgi:lysophospholipase L1-like esterase
MRHSRLSARFALVIFGFILAFVVTEVAVRLLIFDSGYYTSYEPADAGRWTAHPFLPFAGQPSADLTLFTAGKVEHIRTNAYGFRAHEFPTTKGPQDYFVLCFGGSTTYGYRTASNAETWPERLEQMLAARYPERNVRVFNMGMDLGTTATSLVNLMTVGVHLHPDLVIVYHGFNDLSSLGYRNHRTDYSHYYADLPSEVWRGLQASVPQWMLASRAVHDLTGALDMWMGVNDLSRTVMRPRDDDPDRMKGIETVLRNLRTMHDVARGAGAEIVFSTFQFTSGDEPLYATFNQTLRDFFEKNGYRWVDQARLIPDYDSSVNVDECHFTQKGRDLMAAGFYNYIAAQNLLSER